MRTIRPLSNEKGFALVLALSMLAILSILGAFALTTSTTEVQISGNYNAAQQAFFAADRTLEAAETFIDSGGVDIALDGQPLIDSLKVGRSGLVTGAGNKVEYLRSGPAAGFGSGFQGDFYAVTVTGGLLDATDKARSRARLESQKMGISFSGASSGAQLETTGGGG